MSIDLTSRVGLPVTLLDNNRLEFGDGVDLEQMSERKLSDLAVVAADEALQLSDEAAYYMYRNVHRVGDEQLLKDHNQRFDLTVIPAGSLGDEYIKTSGHYHPIKPGTSVEYPELYYCVSGQATYLMQRHDQNGVISDVLVARVPAGKAIMMPPFYGHVTINELDETLVMANWVESNFTSIYGDYEQKRGGAYYIKNQNNRRNYIKNEKYGEVPEIKEVESQPICLEELKSVPIYDYSKQIDKIELVAFPEKHLQDFEIKKLFKDIF